MQVDVYTPFSALLPQLWALWELVLLAEPLLVLAPSPGHTLLKQTPCITHHPTEQVKQCTS